ncbi:HAMP domain-containing sensor histidine kinase [Clostridium sp. UBA5119]|uniref:HAMP domain-containing sensor histidine kinase n=1 Tax=Clostridium sp. UBA5119 TaxID=1946366 RepID=UPI0032179E4E
MVKNSLFSKMVVTYTIIITVSFTILAAFLSFWFQDYFIKTRQRDLTRQADIIEGIATKYLTGASSYEELTAKIKFISTYINDDIVLVDSNGYVYSVTNIKYTPLIGKQIFHDDLENISNSDYIDAFNEYGVYMDEKIYVMMKVVKDTKGQSMGATLFSVSTDILDKSLSNVYQIIWLSAVFAVIASCIVIYYFSQKMIVNPLSEMSGVARKIAQGDVDKRVEIHSDDEMEEFANAFNVMADSLQKVEQNRKEFISNVSHELRSPMTSIKGFIGGILDGVVPDEKHKYYLNIAYEEIQRLTRLINDLLDLSAVESGTYKLEKVPVDINEIVRICILRNENRIRNKNLDVQVFFEGSELWVLTDADKITQVVTNLLDNAIKYGKEDGLIQISCRKKGKKANISIFNEGANIDKEDIKHIWERFYKVDKSRTQKVSTGLGLSIVKKIVSLHDEEIWAYNKENGVEFIFTLQLAKKSM